MIDVGTVKSSRKEKIVGVLCSLSEMVDLMPTIVEFSLKKHPSLSHSSKSESSQWCIHVFHFFFFFLVLKFFLVFEKENSATAKLFFNTIKHLYEIFKSMKLYFK